jgi:hypothetical protein
VLFPLELTIISLVFLLCFLSGLAWGTYRGAPVIATGLVVAGYLLLLVGTSLWAAQCWDCGYGTENKRGDAVWFALILAWIPAAALVGTVWLGALIALIARLWSDARRHQRGDTFVHR